MITVRLDVNDPQAIRLVGNMMGVTVTVVGFSPPPDPVPIVELTGDQDAVLALVDSELGSEALDCALESLGE